MLSGNPRICRHFLNLPTVLLLKHRAHSSGLLYCHHTLKTFSDRCQSFFRSTLAGNSISARESWIRTRRKRKNNVIFPSFLHCFRCVFRYSFIILRVAWLTLLHSPLSTRLLRYFKHSSSSVMFTFHISHHPNDISDGSVYTLFPSNRG